MEHGSTLPHENLDFSNDNPQTCRVYLLIAVRPFFFFFFLISSGEAKYEYRTGHLPTNEVGWMYEQIEQIECAFDIACMLARPLHVDYGYHLILGRIRLILLSYAQVCCYR